MKLYDSAHFRSSLKDFLFGRASQGLLAILLTLVTIRVLPTYEYGVYLVLIGLIDFMRPLTSLGILPTMQQYLPAMALNATESQFQKFIKLSSYLRWTLLLLCVLTLYYFWNSFQSYVGLTGTSSNTSVLVCLMVFFVLTLEYSESVLEALLEQKYSQFAKLIHTLLRLFGIVFLSLSSQASIDRLLVIEILASIAALFYAEIYLTIRLKSIKPNGSINFNYKEIFNFGLHLFVSQLLYVGSTPGTLRLIVLKVLGAEVAGQFGFMQILLLQINRLMPSLLLVNLIRPMLIAAKSRGHYDLISDASGFIYKTNALLMWPLIPFMYLFGNDVMAFLSGFRFLELGTPMTLMLLVLSVSTQLQVSSVVLQVYQMAKQLAISSLLALLTAFLLFFIKIETLWHVCLIILLANSLNYFVVINIIQKSDAKIHFDYKGLFKILLCLLINTIIILIVKFDSIIMNVMFYFINLILFAFIIKPIANFEYLIIQRTLKKQISLLRQFVSN